MFPRLLLNPNADAAGGGSERPRRAENAGTIARLAAKARGYLEKYNQEKIRADGLKTQVDGLTSEVTTLREKADGSTSARKVEELTAQLRGLKHRAVFDRLAGEAGVKPGATDDLYQLSGWKPEADAVDEAAMKQAIADQKGKRGYLFGEAEAGAPPPADGSTTTTPPPAPKPGPAYGQGGSTTTAPKFTDDQLSDPVYSFNNFEKISAAASERVARGEV
ncbi:MAG: hypothetical protein BGO49_04395 [Planctomycetales bacterium 71-10]|nr:MAG: hypothetical protein BGO49_04395 [Planctomycetales bacterium 71-10]